MPTTPARSFRFDPHTDALIGAATQRDGVTITETLKRSVIVREEIRAMAAGGRLFACTDPDAQVPPGFTQLVFLGGV